MHLAKKYRWRALSFGALCGLFLVLLAPGVALGGDPILPFSIDGVECEKGDRIPDFSHCGWRGGDGALPEVPVVVRVEPVEGDDGARIRAALDYVASLPLNAAGWRGAVQLTPGAFQVEGQLRIGASGVALCGAGAGEGGTVIEAMGLDRRALIRIGGEGDRSSLARYALNGECVPCGARSVELALPAPLKPGDHIVVVRPSTREWIKKAGMGKYWNAPKAQRCWLPGELNIEWERVMTAREGRGLTLDAPLTMRLDPKDAKCFIETFDWPGRIENAGVEDLRLVSVYDETHPSDEEHAWMGVTIENARDAWVARVVFEHFPGSAVSVWETASRVTVQDCLSLAPVSEDGGWRRHTFFTAGGQTLFLRCFSERGRHDFSTGICAPGPNAFVHCTALKALEASGPIGGWATGVLYDNVRIDGNALRLGNLGVRMNYAGWTAVNCLAWQCSASLIECSKPYGSQNWAFGCWGVFEGDGQWDRFNEFVRPRSIMRALTGRRLGREAGERIGDGVNYPEGSTNPTLEEAAAMTKASNAPAPQMRTLIEENIDSASKHNKKASSIEEVLKNNPELMAAPETPAPCRLALENGWLTAGGGIAVGGREEVDWWRGSLIPARLNQSGVGLTRFVPGREGPACTEDVDALARDLAKQDILVLEHHHGLWYDRRRDDHERVRRIDSEVWGPFYEMPWARSGEGTAWDGLSRYDLTRFNPWYFSRLDDFAGACEGGGRILLAQHYFQHNVLEAGAHWADYPWRSANNINHTGFPEPPPYAGDKRIFQAHLFYDVTDANRADLHRRYIRHYLDELGERPNVIHAIGDEFTGPLEFMQFWIDTVAEWEKETGLHPLIALAATKDVQDAILADPGRAAAVDIIDIRYWWYQKNGELYAPEGGRNMSPRQFSRLLKPDHSSFGQIARAVGEYKRKFPGKAVIYSAEGMEKNGWAVVMGGGSLPVALPSAEKILLEDIAKKKPSDCVKAEEGAWALESEDGQYLVYLRGGECALDLGENAEAVVVSWLQPRGHFMKPAKTEKIAAAPGAMLHAPGAGDWLALIGPAPLWGL